MNKHFTFRLNFIDRSNKFIVLNNRFFRLFYLCIALLFSSSSFAQIDDGFWTVPQPENIPDYFELFWKRVITFENGNIPFSENGKWGIKNSSGKVVLPAVYDSLLPGNYNECIIVKNGDYQALNSELLPVFNENMRSIRFESDTYYVVDKKGVEYRYQFSYPSTLTNLDGTKKNHVIDRSKPYETPKELTIQYIDPPYEKNLINYATFEKIKGTNRSICSFFSKDSLYRTLTAETNEVRYLGMNYFLSGSESRLLNRVIDIRNMDTVLTLPKFYTSYFEDRENPYLVLSEKGPEKESFTTIISLQGDTIFRQKGDFNYLSGCLLKKRTDDTLNVDLYSFPNGLLVHSNLVKIQSMENYLIMQQAGTEEYFLFRNGDCIQKFSTSAMLGILDPRYPGTDPVVAVQYDANPKTGNSITDVLTSDGKLLFSGPNVHRFNYEKDLAGIQLLVYNSDTMIFGMYDERNRCFHFTKPMPGYSEQIANNIIHHSVDYWESSKEFGLKIELINFDGDCLRDDLLNGVRAYHINGHTFLITWDKQELIAYDENMNVICKDCWIDKLYDMYYGRSDRQFLAITDRKTWYTEVLDNQLNRVIDPCLAAYYISQGDYFVILNDKKEMEYIRYTDTEYYKQHAH